MVAGTPSSPASPFSSTIGFAGDVDYIRVNLVQNATYRFLVEGVAANGMPALADTFFRIRDGRNSSITNPLPLSPTDRDTHDQAAGTNAQVDFVAPYSGPYFVSVGAGGTNYTTLTGGYRVTANLITASPSLPANHNPVAIANSYEAVLGRTINGNVLGNDTDQDLNTLGADVVSSLVTSRGGVVDILANGVFQYIAPSTGGTGTDTFAYTVRDGAGGSAVGSVTINLTQAISAPQYPNFTNGSDVVNIPANVYGWIYYALDGNDIMTGSPGHGYQVFGGEGDDTFFATGQGGVLHGGPGNDYFVPSAGGGNEYFDGDTYYEFNNDSDTADFSQLSNRIVANVSNGTVVSGTATYSISLIENIIGTNLGDEIRGVGTGNTLSIDNIYTGLGGIDVLFGYVGNDDLYGGADDDSLYGGDGNDNLFGGDGADDLHGGNGSANDGHNYIDGGAGNDTVYGGALDDVLTGGDGNDFVGGDDGFGQPGNDRLIASAGNDRLRGLDGIDTADFSNAPAAATGANLITVAGWGTTTLEEIEIIVGSEFDDQFTAMTGIIEMRLGGGSDFAFATGDMTISGDAGNDFLFGTTGSETFYGGTDNDRLFMNDGRNTGFGGDGDDLLLGGLGVDEFYGDNGDDTLKGGLANDTLDGGSNGSVGDTADFSDATGALAVVLDATGSAVVSASGIGTDTLTGIENLIGGSAGDTLTGNASANALYGGIGVDILAGGSGADFMAGGADSDYYYLDDTGDVVSEAAGAAEGTSDQVFFTNVSGATLSANVEYGFSLGTTATLTGNSGDNVLIGAYASVAQTLYGGDGNDFVSGTPVADALYGGAGVDDLRGRGGNDQMFGGDGNDSYYVEQVGDVVSENAGTVAGVTDIIYSSVDLTMAANVEYLFSYGAAINLTGNSGHNAMLGVYSGHGVTLSGAGGNDLLYGSNYADSLIGGADNDTMFGDAGNGDSAADTLTGGAGNDTYFLKDASDVAIELANDGTDVVYAATNYTLLANFETLFIYGAATSGTGNGAANALIGSYNNTGVSLDGVAGNDTIIGGGAADTIIGGAGADVLTGAGGNDFFRFAAGDANGDAINDFNGNGAGAGDALIFSGYGAGATLAQIGATQWRITYNGGASTETITFNNAATIHASDYAFA